MLYIMYISFILIIAFYMISGIAGKQCQGFPIVRFRNLILFKDFLDVNNLFCDVCHRMGPRKQ